MYAVPKPNPASYVDVLAAPVHMTAELIGGELHLQPRPIRRHNRLNRRISRTLSGDGDQDDLEGWVVDQESELHLGHPDPRSLVLVPDLCGWRAERAPPLDDDYTSVVPDWVCEILSPGTERHDRIRKMDLYAQLGVGWAWLVNPATDLLEVFQLVSGGWLRVQTGGPGDTLTLQPFGVTVAMDGWFRR